MNKKDVLFSMLADIEQQLENIVNNIHWMYEQIDDGMIWKEFEKE